MTILVAAACLLASLAATAGGRAVVTIDTRPGVSVTSYYMKVDGAKATVVLLPGGAGGIGLKNGVPRSENFLVRSREAFAAEGFNVFLVGKPSDTEDLDFDFRTSAVHVADLRAMVAWVKKDTGAPVWLVGTSRGTVSATAAAIAFGNEELAGIVLTSSVTSRKPGAVPSQALAKIARPVLVVHHAKDACPACRPDEVGMILAGLKNAPLKKQVMVTEGAGPRGDRCEAMHWHGYIGAEQSTVATIAAWIRSPTP